tara:strand:- start:13779 stop:14384 length:606 start_codon:yes stop_codon:yes gene_type:complete
MPDGKKVRDYVTPDDSTAIVDYLIDFFNRPDVPELYSKQVAGIPVKEVHGLKKETGYAGQYDRTTVGDKVTKKHIDLESDRSFYKMSNPAYTTYFEKGENLSSIEDNPYLVSEEIRFKRTPRNVVHHEAFGHGLIDAIYGYHKKPHFTRTESFPYMVQVYSNLAKMDRLGIPKDNKYYKKTLKAFNELRRITRNELKLEED